MVEVVGLEGADLGTMAQRLALLPHSARDMVRLPTWVTVCAESARSPRVCVGFPRVLRFPPTVRTLVRCIDRAKFSLSVSEQALERGDLGLFTVT